MPLSDAEYKTLLFMEINLDPTNNPQLPSQADLLWRKNDDRSFDKTLQYLYTKSDVLRWLLESNWQHFDLTRGDTMKKKQQIAANLAALLASCKADILALEKGILSNVSPLTGLIIKASDTDPKVQIDWSDPYYYSFFNPLLDTY